VVADAVSVVVAGKGVVADAVTAVMGSRRRDGSSVENAPSWYEELRFKVLDIWSSRFV
jgi:hypothetical protein